MEKAGIGATLNRCRALASKIGNELRDKRLEHFVDKLLLADVHASLARAHGGRLLKGFWPVKGS
jgi:hypothetical protein